MAVTLVATTPKGFGLPQIVNGVFFTYGDSSVHVLSGQVQLNGTGTIWQIGENWYGANNGFGWGYYLGQQSTSGGTSLVQVYVDQASLQGDGNTAAEVNSPTFRSTSEPCLSFRNADSVSNPTTNFPGLGHCPDYARRCWQNHQPAGLQAVKTREEARAGWVEQQCDITYPDGTRMRVIMPEAPPNEGANGQLETTRAVSLSPAPRSWGDSDGDSAV